MTKHDFFFFFIFIVSKSHVKFILFFSFYTFSKLSQIDKKNKQLINLISNITLRDMLSSTPKSRDQTLKKQKNKNKLFFNELKLKISYKNCIVQLF